MILCADKPCQSRSLHDFHKSCVGILSHAFETRLFETRTVFPVEFESVAVTLADCLASMHSATYCDRRLELTYVNSEKLSPADVEEKLSGMNGVIIAPGFGQRGIEGKFTALNPVRLSTRLSRACSCISCGTLYMVLASTLCITASGATLQN